MMIQQLRGSLSVSLVIVGLLATAAAGPIVMGGKTQSGGGVTVLSQGDLSRPGASFVPYGTSFSGGVRVATGDVNGDGVMDIITGAGQGATSHVKVFDGTTHNELHSFFAFTPSFTGGVSVAAGDVNNDGLADIIVGAGSGGAPQVKAFSGANLAELRSFLAYDVTFAGGVNVAAGDVNGDGAAEIITGTASNGSHVKVFDGLTLATLDSFFAFDAGFLGGVTVAAGDVNQDHVPEIIAGAATVAPHVKVFDGYTGHVIQSFFAYPEFQGGVRVASGDVNGDGSCDIVTSPAGTSASGHVKVFDGRSGRLVSSFFAFQRENGAGINVAAGTAPIISRPFRREDVLSFGPAFDIEDGDADAIWQGDFNNDGIMDLLTGLTSGGAIRVLNGDGETGFSPTPVGTHNGTVEVRRARLNSDAYPDAIAISPGGIQAFIGAGQGSFTSTASIVQNALFEVGDMNGDHLDDVFVKGSGASYNIAFYNENNNSFTFLVDPISVGFTDYTKVSLADVNGDGVLEVIGLSTATDQMFVHFHVDTGTFTAPSITNVGEPTDAAYTDLDRDGKLDALILNRPEAKLTFWRGAGSGRFSSPQEFETLPTPNRVFVGNLDGDGDPDVVVTHDGEHVEVFQGRASNALTPDQLLRAPILLHAGSAQTQCVIDKFDADGRADLALIDPTSHVAFMFLNTSLEADGFNDGVMEFLLTANSEAAVGSIDVNTDSLVDVTDLRVAIGRNQGDTPPAQ